LGHLTSRYGMGEVVKVALKRMENQEEEGDM
jgi:hypothetical protein